MQAVAPNSPAGDFPWRGGLTLAMLVGAVFWPVLGFDFVRWDDDLNITQNPLLTAPWSWNLIGQYFDGEHALWFKPLHWLCYRLLQAIFGFNPAGWHAFNWGLHVLATVLFYAVLRQVCCRLVPEAGSRTEWGAWLGAALWALHPLRAEVVAWATASTYSLTALCLLASFACYLQAHIRPTLSRWWLSLAWVLAVAAYASYPVGLTYGLWLMAVDRWLLPAGLAKKGSWPANLNQPLSIKHACFLAPAVLAAGITLFSRFMAPGGFNAAPTIESVGLLSRVGTGLASLTYLSWNFFWPGELTPNVSPLGTSLIVQLQVTGLALLALLVLLKVWRSRQQHPTWALVGLGFSALALPCLGWTEIPRWPVDRYSYLVHLVLVGGMTVGVMRGAGESRVGRIVLPVLASGLVLISAFAARGQIMIWRDTRALFTHMEQHPHFANSPRQQAHIYVMWARYEATIARPSAAAMRFNQAQQVYLAAIREAVSRQDYRAALEFGSLLEQHFPLTPIMRRERGAWLLRLGRRPEALTELRAAHAALPDDERVKLLLAELQP